VAPFPNQLLSKVARHWRFSVLLVGNTEGFEANAILKRYDFIVV
jgi:hypothetical protein